MRGRTAAATLLATAALLGAGMASAVGAPRALSVDGFVVDQTCLNGDTVEVDLSALAVTTSDPVVFRWDLDGDGRFDTPRSTDPSAEATYGDELRVRVAVGAMNPEGDRAIDRFKFRTIRCE